MPWNGASCTGGAELVDPTERFNSVLSFELVLVFSASDDTVGAIDEIDWIDGEPTLKEDGNDDKGDN